MISIVIPVYNRAEVMRRTITNIFEQTYKDIELIIVDDASTDNIREVVEEFSNRYNIRFIQLKKNHGACFARNVGVENARGEYIAFQDSDDLWMPEKIELQLESLNEQNADICICRMRQVYENGEVKEFHDKDFSVKDITLEEELGKSFFSTQLILGKKACFKEEQFDDRFPRFQDWDLGIRLVKKYRIAFIDRILVERHLQKNSVSNDSKKGLIAGQLLLSKYREDYEKYPRAEARFRTFYARIQELNGISSVRNLHEALTLNINSRTLAKYLLACIGVYGKYVRRK